MSALSDRLPPDAVEERGFVVSRGIRSQLVVLLREGVRLVGMITLVAFCEARAWPDEQPLCAFSNPRQTFD